MSGRLFFVPLFGILILLGASSFIDEGFLFWNKNHRLNFTDFKGLPIISDSSLTKMDKMNSTHTLGTISKSIDIKLVNRSGRTTFTIYAGMNQTNSWIKNNDDSLTLKHEQGHFDICEIYARLLRKGIKKARSLAEAKEIYDKISNDENVEQDVYDDENTFQLGGITSKWQELIRERLRDLDAYENPIINLPIYK